MIDERRSISGRNPKSKAFLCESRARACDFVSIKGDAEQHRPPTVCFAVPFEKQGFGPLDGIASNLRRRHLEPVPTFITGTSNRSIPAT